MASTPSALVVVLKDVARTFPLAVRTEPTGFDDNTACVWIIAGGTSRAGIVVNTAAPAGQRLAEAADQVADWLVECLPGAGHAAVWPVCPLHPDTHPLQARAAASGADWTCPKTGEAVAPVGSLPPAP